MASRPTLRDVARAAGVSIATVNRVVAGGGAVREETARKVAAAAARVGYHGRRLIEQRVQAELPEIRLGILLQKERQAFYRTFGERFLVAAQAVTRARIVPRVSYATSAAPRDFADHMRAQVGQVDAVAAVSVNHPVVTDAVQDLQQAGLPCFSLLSDFAQGERKCYVGLNNLKVGRGAANALITAAHRPGKVALFVGGHRWHGHELRETGFHAQFREAAPEFEVLDTLVNLETRQLTYEATLDLLARHRDMAGIYLAGGGMEGAIAALREETRPRQVPLVVNEVTPESRGALMDGYATVIVGTPLDRLCADLVEMMVDAHLDSGRPLTGQHFLDPILYLPEFF